ncbi:MAG: glycosyltransferase family 9 protein [Pirellulaceae bacterium]|nr:glycosyltransferase family 9 protein [Pirellulaceae bacterium]
MGRSLANVTPQHILLVQTGSVRDILTTIPLAVDIKSLWPESHVSWLVQCEVRDWLAEHPGVDEIIDIQRGWLRRPRTWSQLRAQLKQHHFEIAFDAQGLTKSAAIGFLLGVKTRIGFDWSYAREIGPWLATRRISAMHRHRIDVLRQLLDPWRETLPQQGQFLMPCFESAAESALCKLTDIGIDPRDPWIAIQPSAVWHTAVWPVERFSAVVRHLYRQFAIPAIVLWTNEHERLVAQVVAEDSKGAARVAPATSMVELIEMIRLSRMLLTGDSVALDISSAVNIPCISLHGPTWADEVGPYGNIHWAIQSPLPNLAKRMVRRGPNTAMRAIEVEEVTYHADKLLRRLLGPDKLSRLGGSNAA